MRQLDVPYLYLNMTGEHALAAAYAVLTKDLLCDHSYRTNKEIGVALGVGQKRVSQYLTSLEALGLITIEAQGARRIVVLNHVLRIADLAKLSVSERSTCDDTSAVVRVANGDGPKEDRTLSAAENVLVENATKLLLVGNSMVACPDWPVSKSTVSLGYVRTCHSGTELAFFSKSSSYTYYMINNNNIVAVDHGTLDRRGGLASLTVNTKKVERVRKYDQLPQSSFGYRFWPKAELARDTEHYPNVVRALGCWNENWGTAIPLVGDTYRLIRGILVENEVGIEDLEKAIRSFARDPFWRGNRPGLSTFFDKPARVFEYRDKGMVHDRFARNIDTPTAESGIAVDGVIAF